MPAYRTRDTSVRTLEVTTDAPLPPTVAIISPTPRAFTFPIDNAPYASPSSSPFEPELKPIAYTPPPVRGFSPSSSIGSDSSIYSTPSATASQVSHKRRRSTASDNEHRPKKGDEDYIKRPENAFILFRRKCCEDRQLAQEEAAAADESTPIKKQRQADLSKTISQQWKCLPAEERQYWEDLAKERKKEHEKLYPNYVYRPQRVKDKAKAKKGKGKRDGELESDDSISFMLPVPSPPRSLSRDTNHGRRAVSAPTPPGACQTIRLPTVTMPSCPGSPSHASVPISRRTPRPRIPPPSGLDRMTHYEYLPNDTLLPSMFQQTSFDNLSSHELFQNMFPPMNNQPPSHDKHNDGPLQSLLIPREPTSYMPSNLVSPVDSIASTYMLSPADSYSSVSSLSSDQLPFISADTLPMNSLQLTNHSSEHTMERIPEVNHVTDDCANILYSDFSWPSEVLWPSDESPNAMLPDDFDLSSIPPIEVGRSMFTEDIEDGVMSAGCEFDGGEFVPEENDYHDLNPGHDPFASLFTYDSMNW